MRRLILALLLCAAPAAAEVTVSDDRGPQTLAAPPERIVALSWAPAELLVELDVAPAGVADPEGYATWVGRPALPAETPGVGLRTEPSFERIAELAPDLILASDQQADILPQLEQIAPVLWFESFAADQDNVQKSRETFRTVATLLDRAELAERRLAELDARLAAAGERVRERFAGEVPPVLPIRLLTPTTVRIHGANSMATAALDGMGLAHPAPGAPTEWGFVQRTVLELAEYGDAIVLQIDPFPAAEELYTTPLWRFMPFVAEGRFATTEPAWTFGGAFSVGYLAEAFADALLRIAPE